MRGAHHTALARTTRPACCYASRLHGCARPGTPPARDEPGRGGFLGTIAANALSARYVGAVATCDGSFIQVDPVKYRAQVWSATERNRPPRLAPRSSVVHSARTVQRTQC